jgi:DNA topoisomerase-1
VARLRRVDCAGPGIARVRRGKGFTYQWADGRKVDDSAVLNRIADLVIPPAWDDVWICADEHGHLLATGEDDRGRKQYLYHPRWRELRDLLNFYRLVIFAERLPKIRGHVAAQLRRRTLDRDRVLAAMVRIIDASALRVGSEVYAEDNDTFGLSTLTKRHARVRAGTVEFSFPAKSGHRIRTTLADRGVARVIGELHRQRSRQLFTVDGQAVTAADVNALLGALTGEHITAKDFRTWSGTLAAFCHLREQLDSERPPGRIAVDAIDEAAQVLGNTRAVARAHYVHPHVVSSFAEDTFSEYLDACTMRRSAFLDDDECALLAFLKVLLEREFDQLI